MNINQSPISKVGFIYILMMFIIINILAYNFFSCLIVEHFEPLPRSISKCASGVNGFI